MVIFNKNGKLVVKEFQFDSRCEYVRFEQDGSFKAFIQKTEIPSKDVLVVYEHFREEKIRYAIVKSDKPILFEKLVNDPLQKIGEKILDKSLEYCQNAYQSDDNNEGFFSIGEDKDKKIEEKFYSSKVFWVNDTANKTLYIAFRGTVGNEKAEFLWDWITNLDIKEVEHKGKIFCVPRTGSTALV